MNDAANHKTPIKSRLPKNTPSAIRLIQSQPLGGFSSILFLQEEADLGSSVIGYLRVNLGLDSAAMFTGSSAAERRAEQMGRRIGESMRGAADAAVSVKGAIAGIATGATVAAFSAAAKRALEFSNAITDLSARTGVSTRTLQEFRFAAQSSGSSIDAADSALEKFARNQGLAQQGSDTMVKLFRSLGITSTDYDTALRQAMDGIAKLPTVQQRATAAMQLFGQQSISLTSLLSQGSKGFDDLAGEAQRLGVVLSDDVLNGAADANGQLDRMKTILDAQFANTVAQNAASILSLANGVAKLTGEILKFMASDPQQALAFIGGLGGAAAGWAAGGPLGAAVGTAAGGVAGYKAGGNLADNNRNPAFRLRAAYDAREAYRAAREEQKRSPVPSAFAKKVGDARDEMYRQAGLLADVQKTLRAQGGRSTGGKATVPLVGNNEAATAARTAAAQAKAAQRAREKAAREAAAQAKKDARRDTRFTDEMGRSQEDQLRSQLDLTVDQTERVRIQQALLDAERDRNIDAINNDDRFTDEQKKQLVAMAEKTAHLKAAVLHQDDADRMAQIEFDHAKANAENESDILQAREQLARTAKERRDIELQLLKIQFDMLRLEQEKLRDEATRKGDTEGRQQAEARLRTLGQLQSLATADVIRRTQGPVGQLLDSVPRSAAEMNEALEGVAAGGLGAVIDGLSDAAAGARSLADVFTSVANDIIRQLLRIAIQKTVLGPLTSALGLGGSSAAAGSIDYGAMAQSSLDSFTRGLPGRDKGGAVTAGKSYWVGERRPEIFTPSVSGRIIANDDIAMGGGMTVEQHLHIAGGVDLATRTEVVRLAQATKAATLSAVNQANKRRG